MTYCFLILLESAWITVFILLEVPGLQHILGGTAVFFYMIPVLPLLGFKRKYMIFSSFIWATTVSISCIVLINYISIWFINNTNTQLNGLISAYILTGPLWVIFFPYVLAITTFFNMRPPGAIIYEIEKPLRPLALFSGVSFLVPLASLWPLIFNPLNVYSNKYASGYAFGLLAFILGSIWLLIYVRDINREIVIYLSSRVKDAMAYDPKNIFKIIVATIALVLWSAIEEFLFRGKWVLWIESVAALVPLFLIVSRIAKILATSQTGEVPVPREITFPSWRSGKHLTILVILAVIGLTCRIFR